MKRESSETNGVDEPLHITTQGENIHINLSKQAFLHMMRWQSITRQCGACRREIFQIQQLQLLHVILSYFKKLDCSSAPQNAVRPHLSELRNPALRYKTGRNGFLPKHFTPLIQKPRCLTPTRNVRNGYVQSIEK